jgi:hypothetical protein
MLEHLAAQIGLGRIDTGIGLVVAADLLDERLVESIVERGRIPAARIAADPLPRPSAAAPIRRSA